MLFRSLRNISLDRQNFLEIPGQRNPYVYFIEKGVVSIAAATESRRIQVAMVGPGGVVGLGHDDAPYETTVHFPSEALRIPREDLNAFVAASPSLRELLDRYRSVVEMEIAQSAVAIGTARAPARIARWLLMFSDRLQSHELQLKHDMVAAALAVRRPTVTLTIQDFQGLGALRAGRGSVKIVRRKILEEIAGEFYGKPEAEYERLIRDFSRNP
jgi:CRP-like cAMP-binding protein